MFLAQGHPQQDTVPVRPSFTRSQSDLSASSSNNHILSNSPSVLVKKRHSTYITVPEPASPIVGTAPQRPPRNPARPPAVLPAAGTPFPVRPKAKGKLTRPSTATGTRADVTPWEFKNTGTREDVTPWELHPAPDYQDSKKSPKTAADHSPPKVTYRSSVRLILILLCVQFSPYWIVYIASMAMSDHHASLGPVFSFFNACAHNHI